MKPEEAFNHVKALWPQTETIKKKGIGWSALSIDKTEIAHGNGEKVDWTPEVTEWPLLPKWEAPIIPYDTGKVCEFSDDGNIWIESCLIGYNSMKAFLWMSTSGNYAKCRINRKLYPLEIK